MEEERGAEEERREGARNGGKVAKGEFIGRMKKVR